MPWAGLEALAHEYGQDILAQVLDPLGVLPFAYCRAGGPLLREKPGDCTILSPHPPLSIFWECFGQVFPRSWPSTCQDPRPEAGGLVPRVQEFTNQKLLEPMLTSKSAGAGLISRF
jgi:hypothetical protein